LPDYLTKKFRQATGTGVHEYLRFLRLQQAALELAETKETVTEIALRCGFSDGNYFKDCFRKKHDMSPRAFREIYKQ
jgi:AraC-like DNA-binding protein